MMQMMTPPGFKEEDFLCLFHCKSMVAKDLQGGAISDPRGMLGRIYVKLRITMLLSKYKSFGCCGFREDSFHVFSIISLWQIMMPSRRGLYGSLGHG